MPKRTTTFQMVVNFVRKHYAQPGVTVTESKLLHDVHLDIDREVDIVIEGSFDGEPVVTSIEVIEHGRPATITWVQEQIRRHQYLPTNRLVLVSKSGFTKNALKAVAREGGRVAAVTPQIVEVADRPVVKSLFMDQLQFRTTACRMHVLLDDDLVLADVFPDEVIYDTNGAELGSARELARETLGISWLRRRFSEEAHNHPERDDLERFTCGVAIINLGYHLRAHDTGKLCLVAAIELEGGFNFAQQELALTIANMADRLYGFGEAPILGRQAIWVATTDQETQKTTLSWRAKDDKPLNGQPATLGQAPRFPGLSSLEPPPDGPSDHIAGDGAQQAASHVVS